jgi:hypothetical protein
LALEGVVTFTLFSPYPHKEISRHPFLWRLDERQGQSERFGFEENLIPEAELRLVIQSFSL